MTWSRRTRATSNHIASGRPVDPRGAVDLLRLGEDLPEPLGQLPFHFLPIAIIQLLGVEPLMEPQDSSAKIVGGGWWFRPVAPLEQPCRGPPKRRPLRRLACHARR